MEQSEPPVLARVAAVCVGRACDRQTPAAFVASGVPLRTYRTAIAKSPVFGPARIGRLGVAGDAQADTRHHGGEDKAVHAHFARHLAWWGAARGRPLRPGEIGENLTLTGDPEPDESTFCLGDVIEVGTALLQVSQPRVPCFKQAQQIGIVDGVARAVAAGRTGLYLRVLREGEVQAGDPVRLLERPHPGMTISEVNRIYHHGRADRGRLLELAELSASIKQDLSR